MASKRAARRKSCDGKIRYATGAEATAEACRLRRRSHWPMQAYRCQFCHGYHVGHMPRKNIKTMQAAMCGAA